MSHSALAFYFCGKNQTFKISQIQEFNIEFQKQVMSTQKRAKKKVQVSTYESYLLKIKEPAYKYIGGYSVSKRRFPTSQKRNKTSMSMCRECEQK
jgi:hypothetical protein